MNGPPQHLRATRWQKRKVRLWIRQDNGKCCYCNRQCIWWDHPPRVPVPKDAFSIEHVIPRRRGGKNDDYNLIGVCLGCNMKQDLKLRAKEFYETSCGGLFEQKESIWEIDA